MLLGAKPYMPTNGELVTVVRVSRHDWAPYIKPGETFQVDSARRTYQTHWQDNGRSGANRPRGLWTLVARPGDRGCGTFCHVRPATESEEAAWRLR